MEPRRRSHAGKAARSAGNASAECRRCRCPRAAMARAATLWPAVHAAERDASRPSSYGSARSRVHNVRLLVHFVSFDTRFGPPDPRATILFACSLCGRLLAAPPRLFCLLVYLDRGFLGRHQRCSVFFVSSFILSAFSEPCGRRGAALVHVAVIVLPAVVLLSLPRLSCLLCDFSVYFV